MKSIYKLLKCVSVAIIWLFVTPLFAQDVEVYLTSSRDSVGTVGDIVRMPIIMDTIHANDVAGENIIAMNLIFTYGTDLTPLAFTTADGMLSSWSVNTNIDQTARQFSFTAAGVNPIALDSGLLFYVDFLLNDVSTVRTSAFSLSSSSDNYFNEGGFDFTMESGQIQINPILELSISPNSAQITTGDSTRINVSGGEAPYTYSLTNPAFGGFVSGNYFLASQSGLAEVLVEDSNGLQGSTIVEVRPFRLDTKAPEDDVFPGDNFQLAITTSDLSSLEVISGSFDFTLSNVSHVSLNSIISEGTLLDGASMELNERTANSYTLAFASSTALVEGDTLIKFEFESDVEATNSYSLSITDNIIFNDDLKGTRGSAQSARFASISPPNLSFPSGNYITNEQVQFTGSSGQAPYSWSVSDGSIGTIDENGLLTILKGGDISVTITDDLGIATSTTLFVFDARVDILDHTAAPESRYNLPVKITELAVDRGFSSFVFEVTYDPYSVDFVGLDQTGTLLEGFTLAQNQIAENKIRIAGASPDSRNSAGVLTNLTFDLLSTFEEGQSSSISFSEITFNEGEPAVIAINGSIKSGTPPTTGDAHLIIDEDENYVFQEVDFVYEHTEADKPLTALKIESLPSVGALTYFGSPVSLNQTIQVSSLDQFKYQPKPNESGLDYDSFAIKVSDGSNFSNYSGVLSFDVTSVNDSPSFDVSASIITLQEDFSADTTVSFTLNEVPLDEQTETIVYTISPESVDFAEVSFDPSAMTVTFSAIADSSGTQVFTITANDGQPENSTFDQSITFTVQSVNDVPTFSDQTFDINENLANGSLVAQILADDKDSDLSFVITAGNTNNAFALSADGLLTVNDFDQLDFETTPTFLLSIDVKDEISTVSATITINLIDVDETLNQSPQISNQTFSINENSPNGSAVGIVTSFDPDGDALSYTITAGNTNDAFSIDPSAGALTVANVSELDFETTPTFSLTVQVADSELNASATITIDLNDVDESGNQSPQIADQTFSIDENSANGISVGMIVAFDPDGDALSYTITAGNTNGAFSIDASAGALTVANVSELDFETTPTFSLTVQVDDSELNASATITIDLNDVDELGNQSPQIADQTFSLDENSANGTSVGMIVASDPDGDALSYTITAGNTNNAFSIDASTGALTVANVSELDFETTSSFTLTIQVDDSELNASATITIDLNDVDESVNQSPQIADQTFSLDENSANGTSVGMIVAFDPDGDALSYTISAGNTNGAFSIDESTGALTVVNVSELDFETTSSFTLTIQVDDSELNASATITIDLNDVDESVNQSPQIADQTFSIDENSANGTSVGMIVAFDPDGDALSYTITAGNTNDAFSIDASTGALTVANVSELDFETTPSFSLTVQVADSELNASAAITITLNDLTENTAPIISDQTFSIDENSPFETVVGTVTASDLEGDVLSYSISTRNDGNAFSISSSSGRILVADPSNLDFELNESFSLNVVVSDGNLSSEAIITINLNDLDETVLGLEEANKLAIYPNPVSSFIKLSNPEDLSEGVLRINNLQGQEVKRFAIKQANHYDVLDLRFGVYIVLLEQNGKVSSLGTIIKE